MCAAAAVTYGDCREYGEIEHIAYGGQNRTKIHPSTRNGAIDTDTIKQQNIRDLSNLLNYQLCEPPSQYWAEQ